MKLSVIIPCLDRAETIGTQLAALARQGCPHPWEVVVADNGSTDESRDVAESYAGRIEHLRVVDAGAQRGAAHARNVGAAASSGEGVVFCDSDDEVGSGWVEAIIRGLESTELVASTFETTKLNTDDLQRYGGNPQEQALQRLWYPPFLPYSGGCGLGARRELHQAIGGFDESVRGLEDADYCIRAQQAGGRLSLAPGAVIHIRHRSTLREVFRQSRRWGKQNTLLYRRHRGDQRLPAAEVCKAYMRDWLRLLRNRPSLRRGKGLARWVYRLGWQIGLAQGALRQRVLPPVILRGVELSCVAQKPRRVSAAPPSR